MPERENGVGDRKKPVDLVFEGGGVKGISLVGAYAVLEERGYEPQNMVGASAGAIVAALAAAGYEAAQLREIIAALDYDSFKDEAWEDRLPLARRSLSILKDLGIYEGKAFLTWMRDLLEDKGVRTFGDLVRREDVELKYRYKAQVIASDVTERRLLVLPRDAHRLGIEDPDDLNVALAVRMSMSIPIFFEPVKFANPQTGKEHLIVDGGMLSNFPVWLFDAEEPQWPTFGLKLVEKELRAPVGGGSPQQEGPRSGVSSVVDYLRSLVDTMMAAHEWRLTTDFIYKNTTSNGRLPSTPWVCARRSSISPKSGRWSCSSRDAPPLRSSWAKTGTGGAHQNRRLTKRSNYSDQGAHKRRTS